MRARPAADEGASRLAALAPRALLALVVLAAGLWPALVEAALPGASAAVASDSLAVTAPHHLTLSKLSAVAAPATVSGFALFAGDELGRALGQGDDSSRFALGLAPDGLDVAGLALASRVRGLGFRPLQGFDLIDAESLRGPPEREPKTRIGGFELSEPFLQREKGELSLGLQWACDESGCGLVEGKPLDPLGLAGEGERLVLVQVGNTLKWVKEAAQSPEVRQTALRLVQTGSAAAAGAGSAVAKGAATVTAGTTAVGVVGGLGVAALFTETVGQYIPAGNGQSIAEWWNDRLLGSAQPQALPAPPAGPYADPDSPFWSQLQHTSTSHPSYLSLLIQHRNWVEEKAKDRKKERARRSRDGKTRQGVTRDNPEEWRRYVSLMDELGYGDGFSPANRRLIEKGLAPEVDPAWQQYFPEDPLGEALTMHHIGGFPLAVPLTEGQHYDSHMPGGTRYNPGGPGAKVGEEHLRKPE